MKSEIAADRLSGILSFLSGEGKDEIKYQMLNKYTMRKKKVVMNTEKKKNLHSYKQALVFTFITKHF